MSNPNVRYHTSYRMLSCFLEPLDYIMMTSFRPDEYRGTTCEHFGMNLPLYPNDGNIFSRTNPLYTPAQVMRYFKDNEHHTVAKTNVILRDPKTGRFLSYKRLKEECNDQFSFIEDLPNTPWS